jgi:hypothetical protein
MIDKEVEYMLEDQQEYKNDEQKIKEMKKDIN